MSTHNCYGALVHQIDPAPSQHDTRRIYYATVAAGSLDEQIQLIDHLIGVAFDVFGACHLDVRVVGADRAALDARARLGAR